MDSTRRELTHHRRPPKSILAAIGRARENLRGRDGAWTVSQEQRPARGPNGREGHTALPLYVRGLQGRGHHDKNTPPRSADDAAQQEGGVSA